MKTKFSLLVLLLTACAWQRSTASTLESSGNGLLNGTYYMRQVLYYFSVQTGGLSETVNIQGTITFDGNGNYSFSGSMLDSGANQGKATTFTNTGNYVISASGLGTITAVDQSLVGDQIVGLVSHGIFIGSTTGNTVGYNDLFIAAPVGSSATNATLKGAYTVAYFDPTFPGDATFSMNADGQGNIGNVSVTGYTGANTTPTSQSLTGVTYSFSNGAANLKFGGTRNSSTLVAGTDLLYISPDGNFIFGGAYDGYDLFVGVRAATSPPSNYDGLYYQAGLGINEAASGNAFSLLDSYYGSFQARAGKIIGHQRSSTASPIPYQNVKSLLTYGGSSDFAYYDSYTLNSDGSSDDSAFAQHYQSSTDGTIRIGYGVGPFLSLNVAIQAPALSGSDVYLSPVGVVNAASSAPFTAQIAPGEFLTLYGSGLANVTDSASLPFRNILDGVQVFINQVAAPVYYVSSTQVSVIVPYVTDTGSVAEIYVVNNGTSSNLVTAFTGQTSTGVFTDPSGGPGNAAALHPDYSVISESSPAKTGETVAVYLTGMGAVVPRVSDGTAAPTNQFNVTTANPLVFLLDTAGHYLQAKIDFSGLAPGFAGLYQINFEIPSGLVSGNAAVEVIGPDSDTFQATLPISTN